MEFNRYPEQTINYKKPRYQRPKKWSDDYAKDWLKFLELSRDPIHNIVIHNTNEYNYLCDGGNRHYTISSFCKAPFVLMSKYLNEITESLRQESVDKISDISNHLQNLDINTLSLIRNVTHLRSNLFMNEMSVSPSDTSKFYKILKPYLDKIRILSNIKFNFIIYKNYTVNEMKVIYLSINKASTKITPLEEHFGLHSEEWITPRDCNFYK